MEHRNTLHSQIDQKKRMICSDHPCFRQSIAGQNFSAPKNSCPLKLFAEPTRTENHLDTSESETESEGNGNSRLKVNNGTIKVDDLSLDVIVVVA
jgi:hypothetical protein